jgi:hypothetical protein
LDRNLSLVTRRHRGVRRPDTRKRGMAAAGAVTTPVEHGSAVLAHQTCPAGGVAALVRDRPLSALRAGSTRGRGDRRRGLSGRKNRRGSGRSRSVALRARRRGHRLGSVRLHEGRQRRVAGGAAVQPAGGDHDLAPGGRGETVGAAEGGGMMSPFEEAGTRPVSIDRRRPLSRRQRGPDRSLDSHGWSSRGRRPPARSGWRTPVHRVVTYPARRPPKLRSHWPCDTWRPRPAPFGWA